MQTSYKLILTRKMLLGLPMLKDIEIPDKALVEVTMPTGKEDVLLSNIMSYLDCPVLNISFTTFEDISN